MPIAGIAWCLLQITVVSSVLAEDCNSNGIEDATDIAVGTSFDCNGNGVPDECDHQLNLAEPSLVGFIDEPYATIAMDVDGDGDADVIAGAYGTPKLAWFENLDGVGSFGSAREILAPSPGGGQISSADLNSDGHNDLLVSSRFTLTSGIHIVTWYRNTNGFGEFVRMPIIDTNNFGSIPIFASDIDNDGDTDVLAGLLFTGDVVWYENVDGIGEFGPKRSVSSNTIAPESIYAADLDGDNDQDVIVADEFYNRLVWYENLNGLGTFSTRKYINKAAYDVSYVVSADIDGDADADIVSIGEDGNTIDWYENTDGMGTFGPQQVITASANGVSRVSATDIDGDGDIDLLWASKGDDNIVFYENTDGNGSFVKKKVFSAFATNSSNIFATDIDRDGDLDVLEASSPDDTIAWHENLSSDCNQNFILDDCDIAGSTSLDCNGNGTPDECEPDCNGSGIPDDCDVTNETSDDCNLNNYPDECEPDCNGSGFPDACDVANQTGLDCNSNSYPDECELLRNDCDSNGVPDECTLTAFVNSLSGPIDTFACPQKPTQLTVTSSFDGLEYRWLKDNVPMTDSVDAVGTNTATLSFPNANSNNIGTYSCEVSMGCIETVSERVSFLLLEEFSIIQQPAAQTYFCNGNTVTFAVNASGVDVTYEWFQNGAALQEQPGKYEDVDSAVLKIIDAGQGDIAEYTCVVKDGCDNEETTTPSALEMGNAAFAQQPANQCVTENDTVSYTAIADTGTLPSFSQWHKNGVPLSDGGNISGSFTDTLVIQSASGANEGSYAQRVLSLGPNCAAWSNSVELEIDACICETPGDIDADGDVDLVDLQLFTDCFGANVADQSECACTNVNDIDTGIDLEDWAALEALLTGP
ncbi:MAG: hypothetical protein DHS20C16_33830 [Phycisphaerae bacterium]|nr:MAG: hypothetical protein DHS20C16_33830 [Phycisphaerae bacterium]